MTQSICRQIDGNYITVNTKMKTFETQGNKKAQYTYIDLHSFQSVNSSDFSDIPQFHGTEFTGTDIKIHVTHNTSTL